MVQSSCMNSCCFIKEEPTKGALSKGQEKVKELDAKVIEIMLTYQDHDKFVLVKD